jgi:hypothetical protein
MRILAAVAATAFAASKYAHLSSLEIIRKAKKRDMDLETAMRTVAGKMPQEVRELIGEGSHAEALIALSSVHHHHHHRQHQDPAAAPAAAGTEKEGPFAKAVGFINTELLAAQEKVDVIVYDCNVFRTEKETLLLENSNMLTALGASIAQATATIANAKGTLTTLNTQLTDLQTEFEAEKQVCATTLGGLQTTIDELNSDLQVAEMINTVAAGECKPADSTTAAPAAPFLLQACTTMDGHKELKLDGKVGEALTQFKSAAAKASVQAVLSDSLDEGLPEPVPEPKWHEVKDVDAAEKQYQEEDRQRLREDMGVTSFVQIRSSEEPTEAPKCTTGGKVNCGQLMDKIDQMVGDIRTEKQAVEAEHQRTFDDCEQRKQQKETQITDLSQQVAESETILSEATATLLKDTQSQNNAEQEKNTLEGELAARMDDCHKEIKDVESSLCALGKVRNALFKQVKKSNPIIQDCELSDWVQGECSVSCGGAGLMQVTRQILTQPGEHGAPCSPAKLERECNNGECPIDCIMSEWEDWSKCTKECGGGVQSHTRQIIREADHLGKPCEELSSSRACNTASCDVDCVLEEWTAWGSCSRACKVSPTDPETGIHFRQRHVKHAAEGNGKCPEPNSDERLQSEPCNTHLCPKYMKCISNIDVALIYDGSGSVYAGHPDPERNFNMEKTLARRLIEQTDMGWDESADAPTGARFAVMQFSNSVRRLNRLAEKKEDQDKKKIMDLIRGDQWLRGGTAMSLALSEAGAVLKDSTDDRLSVVIILTDGQPNNRQATLQAAENLKRDGVRVVTVPIGNNVPIDFMCQVSSAPCSQNMVRAANFETLIREAKRYTTSYCPEVADAEPICPYLSGTRTRGDWSRSFDQQGWSDVVFMREEMKHDINVIVGFERSGKMGSQNAIYHLEYAYYSSVPSDDRSDMTFTKANKWGAFDHAGKHSCPPGQFLAGFYRTGGHNLYNIEEFGCVIGTWKKQDVDCEWADWGASFDKAGAQFCPPGKAIKGIERGGCNDLHCLEKVQCCKIPSEREDKQSCQTRDE